MSISSDYSFFAPLSLSRPRASNKFCRMLDSVSQCRLMVIESFGSHLKPLPSFPFYIWKTKSDVDLVRPVSTIGIAVTLLLPLYALPITYEFKCKPKAMRTS